MVDFDLPMMGKGIWKNVILFLDLNYFQIYASRT